MPSSYFEFNFETTAMFAQYSPSKLKLLRNCPLAFYLRYHLKYEPQNPPENDTTLRDTGTYLHSVLEHSIKGLPVATSISFTKEKLDVSKEFWTEYVEEHIPNVEKFLKTLDRFNAKHGVTKILTEQKLGVLKDWSRTSFFNPDVYFRGVIDLLLLAENKAFVFDHKSGGSAQWGIKNHMSQLDSYKAFVISNYPKVEEVAVGVHFIKEGTVGMEKAFTAGDHVRSAVIPIIDFTITSAENDVRGIGFFKHFRGSHCKYCDFDADCRQGLLKGIERDSAKDLERKEVVDGNNRQDQAEGAMG